MVSQKIIDDILAVTLKPFRLFDDILSNPDWKPNRKVIIFVLLMQVYLFFLPSYLFFFNILSLVLIPINIGLIYNLSQDLELLYFKKQDSELFFYRILYCLALSQIPSLIVNLLNNVLNIFFASDLLLGVFFSALLNIPAAIIAFIYGLKVVEAVTQEKDSMRIFMELLPKSLMSTFSEPLGFRSIRELMVDFKAFKK
ncbi:MAG: hypothetical protein LW817_08720 [Candidatus Caenarcaniphilales bacterium]|jgi:hypothetical protein|nr:hypothetical protein [Candidatus Caenarcaniphilales bacterium]